ncbi:hypothetical protein N665_0308s0021 [Sinapis alba]|nr:hypothetical protein N665_0308s0021 [Sinapis alba]
MFRSTSSWSFFYINSMSKPRPPLEIHQKISALLQKISNRHLFQHHLTRTS